MPLMANFRVLYDGWPLVREPDSPPARHLLAILAHLPANVTPVLALPETPPPWLAIAPGVTHVAPVSNTPAARFLWEQRDLPRLRKLLGAALLHLTSSGAPLLHGEKVVVSPAGHSQCRADSKGMAARLRNAVAQGGMTQAGAVCWPHDLPTPSDPARYVLLPPVVHPVFGPRNAPTTLELPGIPPLDDFVLYHGPQDEQTLRIALKTWTWVVGPLGDAHPLLMWGLADNARQIARRLAQEYKLEETVQIPPAAFPGALADVYRQAAALLHPAEVSPWGGPVRRALACGVPIVGVDTPHTSALVGPAAYLASAVPRDLGAGLLSIIVREDVGAQLREAALQRAAGWAGLNFGQKLGEVYEAVSRA